MPKPQRYQELIAELEMIISQLKAELLLQQDGFVRENYIELVQKPESSTTARSGMFEWRWVGPELLPQFTVTIDDVSITTQATSLPWGLLEPGTHRLFIHANGRMEAFYEWEII